MYIGETESSIDKIDDAIGLAEQRARGFDSVEIRVPILGSEQTFDGLSSSAGV
jgi:hypothetical protein